MKLETILSQTPLQLGRVERNEDKFKAKRLLSMSQPELDTSDAFDIPSPPPVAANRFESAFSVLNQPPPPVSVDTHAGTQEPLKLFDHTDVPDEAPRAPIATIPELEMGTAASPEEGIGALENVPQSGLTPTPTASMENQTTPLSPADRPQADLDPWGHFGAVSESAALVIIPQNGIHQPSATAETSCDESVGGGTSHDQLETPDTGENLVGQPHTAGADSARGAAVVPEPLHHSGPEAGSASAASEISAPEAAPPAAVGHNKNPRLVNQDEVYGALYDSLFPQSFTSEVLSSLSTPPPPILTEDQQSKSIVGTLDDYRTGTSTPTFPAHSAHSATSRDGPIDPYPDRISVSGGSRFTLHQTEVEPSDTHSSGPPSSLHSCFESTEGGNQSEPASCLSDGPLPHSNLKEDTPCSVLRSAAPPVSVCGTAPGRDAGVTVAVPALTRVAHVAGDQVSSRAASPSPAPENKTGRDPGWKTQAPAPPGDMDGFVSPTYLSVGSDDGSAVDIYYSAEEDDTESGDDEMYTVDEGGAQMGDGVTTVALHRELVREGDFSGRDVSSRDEGKCSGRVVQKSGGEDEEDGQARSHGSDARLQDSEKFLKAMAQVEEEGAETRGEKLLAKPVLQGNKLALCDFVPPSAEKCGSPEDSRQIWARKLEAEEPPNGEHHALRLDYLTRKNGESYYARQEVITPAESATAEAQVSIVAGAEKSSGDSRHADGHCATSADPAALVTGSLTRREDNKVPQSAEWVDTIPRSRNREPEVPLHLTDTRHTAAAPLSGSPEHPAGAQLDPSQG